MHVRPYEKLIVWQEAHKLCLSIYEITKLFPAEERFGLVSQMRRASYSVPMNIAEGNAKSSKKEKGHFLEIAHGSLEELHYQLVLSKDLKHIDQAAFGQIDDHVQRVSFLLTKLRSSLR